jgi:hypothetical protein
MKKVYLIRLQGGGDVDEKFVDEEAWNWIISNDMGQAPEDVGKGSWIDQNVPDSVMEALRKEYLAYGLHPGGATVPLTIGSWENDRALIGPSNISLDKSKLDWGNLRESLAEQGFEYTGEVFEGAIY